jgi:hypothetical protein
MEIDHIRKQLHKFGLAYHKFPGIISNIKESLSQHSLKYNL